MLASVAYASENAQSVRFQWEARCGAAEHQDFLSSRVTNIGELFEGLLSLRVGLREYAFQIAAKLIPANPRDLEPAKYTDLGAHAASGCPR